MQENIPMGSEDEIEAIKKLDLPLVDNFREIVLEERALIDVRAPVEFEKGAFPAAINLPLMNNEERHLIGIRYKEEGNASAVALGKELVGPVKNSRVKAWTEFIKLNPHAYLYCFRGGQRSQISQAWIKEAGINIPRLKGGYKAFRHYLMQESERISIQSDTLIVGGRTGGGKTLLIHQLENSIDLEGLANHRGSSFGRFTTPQPTQIGFEDALAYKLIQHESKQHKTLVIEDESHNIGRVYIPRPIFDPLKTGKLIILETPMSERVEITFEEYVTQALEQYQIKYGQNAEKYWFDDANSALDRIKRRLGGERHTKMKADFSHAFTHQQKTGERTQHKGWIEMLLREYYDPMYDYQIEKSDTPVLFRGDISEVSSFIRARS